MLQALIFDKIELIALQKSRSFSRIDKIRDQLDFMYELLCD